MSIRNAVCVSVCVLFITVSPAKTAEPIVTINAFFLRKGADSCLCHKRLLDVVHFGHTRFMTQFTHHVISHMHKIYMYMAFRQRCRRFQQTTQFFLIVEPHKSQSGIEKSGSGISNMWDKFAPRYRSCDAVHVPPRLREQCQW